MKPLQMGKDMKIKHSVSSPLTKYGGTFFVKKLCMGEQTFLGKFMGEYFTWGLMVRSCKGGVAKLTLQIGYWIWKTPTVHYSSGVGDFM